MEIDEKLHGQAERVGDRVSSAVEGFRDRTADVVRADGGSIYREIGKLGKRVDDVEDHFDDQLDQAVGTLTDRIDQLIRTGKRTTLPRKLFWLVVGAGVGVAAAYLGDPDRGRARRAQLSDQAAARSREVADQVTAQAKMAADRAKGNAIETAKDALPEDVPEDPKLLEQRIRSGVFGKRDDTQDVVIRVDAPGMVALKGTVNTPEGRDSLLAEVAEVEGVLEVTSELAVRQG